VDARKKAADEVIGGRAVEVLEVLGEVALKHLKDLRSGGEKAPNSALIRAAMEIVRLAKVKVPPGSKTAAELKEQMPFEDPDQPT